MHSCPCAQLPKSVLGNLPRVPTSHSCVSIMLESNSKHWLVGTIPWYHTQGEAWPPVRTLSKWALTYVGC